METAYQLLQSGRNIYCIFMCHLSLEKALKGLFIKRLNDFPPKLHDLMYFVDRISLSPENAHLNFLMWLNRMAIITRYPTPTTDTCTQNFLLVKPTPFREAYPLYIAKINMLPKNIRLTYTSGKAL